MLGKALDLPLGFGLKLRDVEPGLLEQRHDDALLLLQEGVEQMGIVDDGIALRAGQSRGLLQCLGGLYGQSIWLDHGTAPKQRACRQIMPKRQRGGSYPLPPLYRPYFMMIIFFVNRRPSTISW